MPELLALRASQPALASFVRVPGLALIGHLKAHVSALGCARWCLLAWLPARCTIRLRAPSTGGLQITCVSPKLLNTCLIARSHSACGGPRSRLEATACRFRRFRLVCGPLRTSSTRGKATEITSSSESADSKHACCVGVIAVDSHNVFENQAAQACSHASLL